jgi:hypothetical protein
MRTSLSLALLGLAWLGAACAAHAPSRPALRPQAQEALRARLAAEAAALEPLVEADWVRAFMRGGDALPGLATRVVHRSPDRTRVLADPDFARLPEAEREGWKRIEATEELAYVGGFGTPLAYARALDLAAQAGLDGLAGRRVLDFGFGAPGQLVLLAALGATAVGVDPAPVGEALYREFHGLALGPEGSRGRVEVHFGRFPAEPDVRRALGQGYHLFVSKNVLKRGYIHPAREAPAWQLIDLGVDDRAFTRAVAELLAPGGLAIVYNLYPAQSPPDQPYIPWADGQTAFEEALWREAGLEVLVFDQDDSDFIRRMGRALGWDQGEDAMDLERDLFAIYTLLRKPGPAGKP